MEKTIALSAEVIRARVMAVNALHVFMNETESSVLTHDNALALNQGIVSAVTTGIMRLSPWVTGFRIEPSNFYNDPDSLLTVELTIKLPEKNGEVASEIIREALEEYTSNSLLAELYGGQTPGDLHKTRAVDSLDRAVELFEMSQAGSNLRIKRTI